MTTVLEYLISVCGTREDRQGLQSCRAGSVPFFQEEAKQALFLGLYEDVVSLLDLDEELGMGLLTAMVEYYRAQQEGTDPRTTESKSKDAKEVHRSIDEYLER